MYGVMPSICRLLLRHEIGFREFSDLAKAAFVQVATEDYGIRGRPTNISRVAVMTGLTRKEVKRLRDFNVEFGYSANELGFVMSDAYFSETTNNPWQPIKTIIVNKDQNNTESISFPKRLNIKMTPGDFSLNNPVISWDAFPEADNDYLVIVLLKDQQEEKDIKYDNDQNKIWDVVFSKVVKDCTEVQVFSNKLLFNPVYPAGNVEFNQIIVQPGELIRIEVYALDGSGRLNTITKSGALYMDSINIKR